MSASQNHTGSGVSPAVGVVYLIGYECWGVVGLSPFPLADEGEAVAPRRAASHPIPEIRLSPQHRRYLAAETAISVVINVALSAAFAWAMFGGRDAIAAGGAKGFAVDFLPQTFMISLMSVVVPTLLTRKRLSAGRLNGVEAGRLLWPLWMRAPLMAIVATMLLGGAAALLSPILAPNGLGFWDLLPIKLIYGAVVAVLMTPLGLALALSERPRASGV